jgi:AcrR family transcriptional regulator
VPRPPLHSPDSILDAARDLLRETGARALTVDAIARASGAPVGSIYHRFGSLEELLAEMWIASVRRFQTACLSVLDTGTEPLDAALNAAGAVHDFARDEPGDALLLASLRREDLFEAARSDRVRAELEGLNRSAEEAIAALSRRLYGNAGPTALARTRLAVADIPVGAVRPYLLSNQPLPRGLRTWVESAVRAVLT